MLAPLAPVESGSMGAYKGAGSLEARFPDKLVSPHRLELEAGERFIYRREMPTGGHDELFEVEPATGKGEPALDHRQLATELGEQLGKPVSKGTHDRGIASHRF